VSWTTPLGLTASVGELLADARTGENPSGIAPGLLLAMASAHQKGEAGANQKLFSPAFGTGVRGRGNKRAPDSISPPAGPTRA
jgi:hypothetical protein